MSTWPLLFLMCALLLLSAATFLIFGAIVYGKDPTRRQLVIAAVVVVIGAVVSLWIAQWLGGAASGQKALATRIAEQIRSKPLKVEISGNGANAGIDEKALSNSILTGLRSAPLDVQVTKAPPFDNKALAKEISARLSLPRFPSGNDWVRSVVVVLSFVLIIGASRRPGRHLWHDPENLIGIAGILVAVMMPLFTMIVDRLWPPRADAEQMAVSFDTADRSAEQVFFDASAEEPIQFNPGGDIPPPEAVCAALDKLNEHGSTVAIVVGSHDQEPLSRNAELRFSSNSGLARQRARAVRDILVGEGECVCSSSPIKTVITLSNGPLNVGERHRDKPSLEKDRTVKVYGLAVR